MHEIDVAVTDYILFIECLIFSWLIHKSTHLNKSYQKALLLVFMSLAVSALIGGTYHGFFSQIETTTSQIIWTSTLICIGITAYGFVLLGVYLLFGRINSVYLHLPLTAGFLFYVVSVSRESNFLYAILVYLPAIVILIIGMTKVYVQHRGLPVLIGIIGLLLSIAASAVQQLQWSIHPVYFSYNAVYHVILMFALWLFYIGAKGVEPRD